MPTNCPSRAAALRFIFPSHCRLEEFTGIFTYIVSYWKEAAPHACFCVKLLLSLSMTMCMEVECSA